jgi:SAM-dependent methyltransferase
MSQARDSAWRSLFDELSESELAQPREKPFSPAASIAYRWTRLARPLLGRKRLLGWYLELSRLFQRLAFEICGEVYGEDFHAERTGVSRELVLRLLPPGGLVLDLGCGTGRWCAVAAERAGQVIGLDTSPTMLETARKRFPAANIDYRMADVETKLSEQLEGLRFDLVLLFHVLEHIDDADALLRDLTVIAARVLVEVPDFDSDPLNYARLRLGRSFYSDSDHVREYTAPLLERQLSRAGWKVNRLEVRRGSIVAAAERSGTPR